VDLSEGSCRLLTEEAIPEASKISVQVPSELCGDDGFTLPGRVVRCQRDHTSPEDGGYAVAVQFSTLGESALSLLDEALAAHQLGAASPRDRSEAAPDPRNARGDESSPRLVRRVSPRDSAPQRAAGAGSRPAAPEGSDRRKQPRVQYSNRVVAAAADGSLHRVLIGRDLSSGGMRADRQKDLVVGSTLRIALYDPTRETPVVVMATVLRDDGERGLALRFDDLLPEVAQHLEQLVASLPPVERLQDGELGSMGTVVSEILG
jgi:hypothetical protein